MSINNLLRTNIKNLNPYVSARSEYMGNTAVLLDANENPFPNEFNRYPDPLQIELKKEIAKNNGVNPSQIFIGNGSDETLDLLIRAFCEPGLDNVVIMPPTYGMYEVLATINGVECRAAPLNEDFSLNTRNVFNAIDENSKIVFICSPNNPTGNTLDQQEIHEILNGFKGLVVLDEAYIEFSTEPSFIGSLKDYSRLFINQTFSKYYGGAGLRLGMGFASPELIEVLNRIKPPYNINTLSQSEGIKLIRNTAQQKVYRNIIQQEKVKLAAFLTQLAIVEKVFPSDANFFLVRFKKAEYIFKYLCEKGVVVRNRSSQMHCENTLRISIGTPNENEKLIKQLNEINKKIK